MINQHKTVNWYPVYTYPQAEKKAWELLQKKGIETYLPLKRQLKQWSDRKKWVEEPLIKSYIFVKITARQQMEVLMTKGISRFLYFSGKVASMPEQQIIQLKLLLATAADLEVIDHELHPGERVYIKAGPLQGLHGELIEFKSQKRLIIRIDHIGQSLMVQIPMAFIEPIG